MSSHIEQPITSLEGKVVVKITDGYWQGTFDVLVPETVYSVPYFDGNHYVGRESDDKGVDHYVACRQGEPFSDHPLNFEEYTAKYCTQNSADGKYYYNVTAVSSGVVSQDDEDDGEWAAFMADSINN